MVGSKHAGVFFVMSLGISSSDIPTANRAAIFAIGKPVALLASAELRENARIHFDNHHPGHFSGFTANCNVRTPGFHADFADKLRPKRRADAEIPCPSASVREPR